MKKELSMSQRDSLRSNLQRSATQLDFPNLHHGQKISSMSSGLVEKKDDQSKKEHNMMSTFHRVPKSQLKSRSSYKSANQGNAIPQVLIVDDNIFNLSTLQTLIKLKFEIESVIVSSG